MSGNQEVRVWDPLVRIFHWSLVIAFALAYVTGETETVVHDWLGYAVLALIAVRLVWGFVGSHYARFGEFVYAPRTVLGYARDMVTGRSRRYLGHNPLGGWMVIALLVSLTATGISGYALHAGDGAGSPTAVSAISPIATAHAHRGEKHDRDKKDGDDGEDKEREGGDEWLEEVHEFLAELTLLLVFLHVGGVALSSLMHRENLVRAMFTGRKRA